VRPREAQVLALLAKLLRGVHYVVGISLPAPGTSDRKFVLFWLAGIAVIAVVFVTLILVIPRAYFRQ
jgi:hypothetical protein